MTGCSGGGETIPQLLGTGEGHAQDDVGLQMAEVAVPSPLFAEILRLIDGLRPAPLPP